MATSEQHPIELRPFTEQEPFLESKKKYYGYVSGVGAGKTYAGCLRTALNVEQWNPGEMGAIVAPTSTMIKDVILPVMREMGLMDHWDYKSHHTDEPGIHAPNGARILLLSADNRRTIERLRGLNLAWWWIDEEAGVESRARDILTQRLRVGNYRNGFITTTPKGRNHTYDFFVDSVNGEYRQHGDSDIYEADDRLALLRVPSHANPHTPQDYKEQLDRDHSGQFYEQEVLGEFVQFEGLVYPWFGEGHIVSETPADVIRSWIYGVDWGTRNPSVILAIGVTPGGYVVVDEFYAPVNTYGDLAETAVAMQEAYKPGRFFCDPSEPAGIEEFRRKGLDAIGAENDVIPGIKTVNSMADSFRVHEQCQHLINEFGQYQYKEGEDEPVKANDHCCDGLRYAIHTHDKHGEINAGVAFG